MLNRNKMQLKLTTVLQDLKHLDQNIWLTHLQ